MEQEETKRAGRKRAGEATRPVQFYATDELIERINAHANQLSKAEHKVISQSEAIRRLIDQALGK